MKWARRCGRRLRGLKSRLRFSFGAICVFGRGSRLRFWAGHVTITMQHAADAVDAVAAVDANAADAADAVDANVADAEDRDDTFKVSRILLMPRMSILVLYIYI